MLVPQSLPEIWTSPDFAQEVGREAGNVSALSARGLLAAPTHSYRGKPAWLKSSALDWFTVLHDHAVVVPANDLAFSDLRAYGVYMCPLTEHHMALARPEFLVMYERESNGRGRVFPVTAVETVHQVPDGTRPTSLGTTQIIRNGTAVGTPGSGEWTVFYLDQEAAAGITSITPAIQKGRYVPVADVRHAMTSSTLAVPTLDVAFPKQW